MTKTGNDQLKRRARRIARDTGRRFPDVLAELPGQRRRAPSKELVLVCSGLVHPIDGGHCARPAGHRMHEWGWGGCSDDPHHPAHIWQGYFDARAAADRAQHEAWLASLTQEERAEYEAEEEAAYWADMADEAREPYDAQAEKSLEYALDAADEERWAAEAEAQEDASGYDEDAWDEDCR
ncbi:hypothetical protein JBF12_01000 [Streptomyces javensis]|uniref:Uncharacterized protein n=1 Tax=Streptomyces javensis TaxID=114698 RepID=A0ABS0R3U7_9ACTN|nr:hypothetical protein [Streptomyces javensis]